MSVFHLETLSHRLINIKTTRQYPPPKETKEWTEYSGANSAIRDSYCFLITCLTSSSASFHCYQQPPVFTVPPDTEISPNSVLFSVLIMSSSQSWYCPKNNPDSVLKSILILSSNPSWYCPQISPDSVLKSVLIVSSNQSWYCPHTVLKSVLILSSNQSW